MIYQYKCKEDHLIELFSHTYDVPKVRTCGFPLENGKKCRKKAEKQISLVAVIFQPYAFGQDGYASYSDRQKLFKDQNVNNLGTANKEAMTKNPNRSFTRYGAGSSVKRVKTVK